MQVSQDIKAIAYAKKLWDGIFIKNYLIDILFFSEKNKITDDFLKEIKNNFNFNINSYIENILFSIKSKIILQEFNKRTIKTFRLHVFRITLKILAYN